MAGVKGKSGAKPGYVRGELDARWRERIKTAQHLRFAEDLAQGRIVGDPKRLSLRLQAATMLLKKTIPDLSATDITSKGEAITIERVMFKRAAEGASVAQSTADNTADDNDERSTVRGSS